MSEIYIRKLGTLLGCILVGGLGLCALARLLSAADSQAKVADGAPSATIGIVLGRHGCTPEAITFASGLVSIDVLVKTATLTNKTIHLNKVQSDGSLVSLGQLAGVTEDAHFHQIVQIPAGSYSVTVEGDSRWACPITVH